jgi:CheY-like chemotaxis protein
MSKPIRKKTPSAPQPVASAEAAPARPKVLLVEDYADAREMYGEYLEFAGFQVEMACNGVEAIEKAQERPPDVILMDMSLPLMNGWEATRHLKGDAQTRDIPVVALTGHVLPQHSSQAEEAGCDSFVTKPCLPTDVVKHVRELLSTRKLKAP